MKNRRKIALFFALGLVVAAGTFRILRPREPVYGGRTLTTWLLDLSNVTNTKLAHDRAIEALRKIGTNGIPFLEEMLRPDPWWKSKLVELLGEQPRIGLHFTTAWDRHRLALRGIEILGPVAEPLIPRLIEMLNGDTRSMGAGMVALARIGPAAVLPLTKALTNTSPRVRGATIETFALMGSNALSALPAILQHLDDSDNRVRASAAMALGMIGEEPTLVVPALARHLDDLDYGVRGSVAEALGRFGSSALIALPALVRLRGDSSEFVQAKAAFAIEQIKSETTVRSEFK